MTESSRFRTALLLSLTVNVLLATALAAGYWRQHDRDGHGGGRMAGPRAMARVLPEADRAVLQDVMSSRRGDMRPRIVEARRARQAVRHALLAEPFDPAQLERAFADLRLRDSEVTGYAHELMAEVAGKVSPEGRRAMAQFVSEARRGRRGR